MNRRCAAYYLGDLGADGPSPEEIVARFAVAGSGEWPTATGARARETRP
ncbi:MAG TPA: hypothetical protein VFQ21_01865 [Gemmatimonadota bacterium]|nr:hypothetical protein [Gemmatimonadota bacterium]